MNSKFLTELGWKAMAVKCKVKDTGLQKALAAYENADEKKFDERLKCLASIGQLAAALKKTKDTPKDAADYLGELIKAAESEKTDLTRQKTSAEKAIAEAAKRQEALAKKTGETESAEEEEEEEAADYKTVLLTAFQKLKGAKDLAFQFVIADAKPHCGLMVAKKITPKHKQKLMELTGSRRFLPIGTCQFVNARYVFTLEKPVPGLAKKVQDSIKNYIGKKLPIQVGTETAEGEEGLASPGTVTNVAPSAPPGVKPALAKAPETWRSARGEMEAAINRLKATIRQEFGEQGGEVIAEIEKNMGKLDVILQNLDTRLAESLDKARSTADAAARAAELQKSKALLATISSM